MTKSYYSLRLSREQKPRSMFVAVKTNNATHLIGWNIREKRWMHSNSLASHLLGDVGGPEQAEELSHEEAERLAAEIGTSLDDVDDIVCTREAELQHKRDA